MIQARKHFNFFDHVNIALRHLSECLSLKLLSSLFESSPESSHRVSSSLLSSLPPESSPESPRVLLSFDVPSISTSIITLNGWMPRLNSKFRDFQL